VVSFKVKYSVMWLKLRSDQKGSKIRVAWWPIASWQNCHVPYLASTLL